MTARKSKAKAEGGRNDALEAFQGDDETRYLATARTLLAPDARHGMTAAQLFKTQIGKSDLAPGIGDYAEAIAAQGKKAATGDLAFASKLLAAQAVTLDAMFTEMARRMAMNMGEYLGATETYARIAMKAQAGSRAALEALAKLHQPREQTVRHVHVNEGGQAVIADQFHNHPGGSDKMDNQANNPMQPGTTRLRSHRDVCGT